jgi:hypothetical protein
MRRSFSRTKSKYNHKKSEAIISTHTPAKANANYEADPWFKELEEALEEDG